MTMNKQIPETKQPLINLALAVADVLEYSSTPATLAEALNEVTNQLIDLVSGDDGYSANARILRGLVALSAGDGMARPEATAKPGAKAMVLQWRVREIAE